MESPEAPDSTLESSSRDADPVEAYSEAEALESGSTDTGSVEIQPTDHAD